MSENLEEVLSYDDLAERWSMDRDTVRRLVRLGIVTGSRNRKWFTTWHHILHEVEGRQSPLLGQARTAAKTTPLTVADVAKRLKRSEYTVREMLKSGELAGWKIRVPGGLRDTIGKRVANRWFVDAAKVSDYIARQLETSLGRRFNVDAQNSHINAQG